MILDLGMSLWRIYKKTSSYASFEMAGGIFPRVKSEMATIGHGGKQ